jgi:hypothetical protein
VTVTPGDGVRVLDRVWIEAADPVTFTLQQRWPDLLQLLAPVNVKVGEVTTGTHTIEWQASGVAPSTWHTLTADFVVRDGDWTGGTLTKTLAVEWVGLQLDPVEIPFSRDVTCVEVQNPDLTIMPAVVTAGEVVTLTGSVATGASPVYTWDFGDGSGNGSGNPVTHIFPLAGGPLTYTVTMTAQNGCPSVASLSKPVMVRPPYALFLPVLVK